MIIFNTQGYNPVYTYIPLHVTVLQGPGPPILLLAYLLLYMHVPFHLLTPSLQRTSSKSSILSFAISWLSFYWFIEDSFSRHSLQISQLSQLDTRLTNICRSLRILQCQFAQIRSIYSLEHLLSHLLRIFLLSYVSTLVSQP